MKRLISPQGLMQLLASLAKFAVVGLIVISTVRVHLGEPAALGALDLLPALTLLVNMIWDVAPRSDAGPDRAGDPDCCGERRCHLQALRMTKQEVKEEARQTEGDPEVRGQIRGRRLRFMQNR
ncbi:MAG: EscU/YscU/HrcU family type III secretion system export apparatus switch protein [Dehalococcoidia bacterium]